MQRLALKGHSGCKLEIINGVVFKSTFDLAYSERLKKQCQKQKNFYISLLHNTNIVTPEVLDEYWENNSMPSNNVNMTKLGFTMPYCSSENFIEFFESHPISEIKEKIHILFSFIDANIKECSLRKIKREILYNKYQEIKNKLERKTSRYFAAILSQILKEINNLTDTIELPIGKCHGDLTFSNLLFSEKKIILIDFLDNFIETPLQDIVKLRQDTRHFWSLNLYDAKFDTTKIRIILKFLDDMIHTHYSAYPFYRSYYKIFQKINLLRILPYTKDEEIIKYIFREISVQDN